MIQHTSVRTGLEIVDAVSGAALVDMTIRPQGPWDTLEAGRIKATALAVRLGHAHKEPRAKRQSETTKPTPKTEAKRAQPTMEESQLHGLMLRAIAGDNVAYRQMLEEISVVLRSYVRRRLFSGPDEAEDVVQEVLMAVHAKRHTYDPGQPVTAWLFAIARYKLIDHLRRRMRRGVEATTEAAEGIAAEGSVEGGAIRRDIERLLQRLPEKQRRSIQLVKLQQLSVREAAAQASMSEADIKISVHRGMKTLSRLVSEEDPT